MREKERASVDMGHHGRERRMESLNVDHLHTASAEEVLAASQAVDIMAEKHSTLLIAGAGARTAMLNASRNTKGDSSRRSGCGRESRKRRRRQGNEEA
eukprot:3432218-Rhodomonas_salina.2